MSLNLKNPDTYRLARELAAHTGESMTQAVTKALRERLDRVRQPEPAGLADRLRAIALDCAGRMIEPHRSIDHGDLLYDENGLPR